ncbi:glycosyltransferase family 2 protein [Komarekiella sp. 'clone 1']|uniref:Glycosyltransferase family 2 protein n=1 Tax=Komarekiella delphini-convector SJRDD-AB1 TaxID=2593771 RepID=A0AA40SZH1_9NOST|nr:glycosyltransferase family 2 protein [Komarekiella delphini-convector]MBD6617930.1 glycosyltransferase family 2 protein [Komarekiella delphini-convector SJRDD-AB1]
MKNKCSTTVLILTCNRSNYLSKALASVYAQTYKDYKIVISDCSDDLQERGKIKEIVNEYKTSFPNKELLFIQQLSRLPQALHLELVMKEVSTPYVGLLDDDDIWQSHHLERSIEYLDNHENIGITISNGISINEEGEIIGFTNSLDHEPPNWTNRKECFNLLMKTYYGSTSGYIFRIKAIQNHKFYNTPCVDVHLAITIICNNFDVKFFKEASYFYLVHKSSYYGHNPFKYKIHRHTLRLWLFKNQGLQIITKYPNFTLLFFKSIFELAILRYKKL